MQHGTNGSRVVLLLLSLATAGLSATMKAAGFDTPHPFSEAKVTVFDAPVPTPVAGEILVRVEGSSINHLDLLWQVFGSAVVWDAAEAFWSLSGGFPKILGMDIAGEVVAVGSGVTRFKLGDAVWSMNAAAAVWDGKTLGGLAGHGWARYVTLGEKYVGLKPQSLNFTEAGSLPLVSLTSLAALKSVGAPWAPGATVLILGSTGGTGHVAVQLAKALGATTVIATGSAKNRDFVTSLGADRFIDYHAEDWQNSSVIADRSIDAVYDTVLREGTGDSAFAKLKDGGKYVTLCTGIPTCGAPMPSVLTRLGRPSLTATALRCTAGSCASAEALDELRSIADAGKLRAHVDAIVPLADIQQGIDILSSGHALGKVAITMAGNDEAGIVVV